MPNIVIQHVTIPANNKAICIQIEIIVKKNPAIISKAPNEHKADSTRKLSNIANPPLPFHCTFYT